ncbi:MAG TPA: hypothetical protein VL147_11190 [Devosia sp.]|nr:hypothetical protein [Devosia sp.]
MLDDFYPSDEYETDGWDSAPKTSRPADIIRDPNLTTEEKRGILASWASDARAVIDAPSLRRLDDGTLLEIDTILDALKQLDGDPAIRHAAPARFLRRRTFDSSMRRITRPWRRDDDDDDPPPCPAAARVPRLPLNPAGDAAVAAA